MYKLKEFPSKWGCLNGSLSKYCSTNLNRKHIYNRFETMSCWTILQPQTSHNIDRAPYTIVLCIAFHHCRYTFRLTNMAASHVSCIKFGPAQVVQYGQLRRLCKRLVQFLEKCKCWSIKEQNEGQRYWSPIHVCSLSECCRFIIQEPKYQ